MPDFQKIEKSEFEIISSSLEYATCSDIQIYEDYLIVVANTRPLTNVIHLYKKTGEKKGDYVHYGRGPGEVLHVASTNIIGNILSIYDNVKGCIIRYDIDSMILGEIALLGEEPLPSNGYSPEAIIESKNKTVQYFNQSYIGSKDNVEGPHRISLFDELGNELSYYDDTPIEDKELLWNMYMQPRVCASPDFSKFVVAPMYGALLEIFDIRDIITKRKVYYFKSPGLNIDSGKLVFTPESTFGFVDLAASDKYIYAGFIGDNSITELMGDNSLLSYPNVALFDWNGKAIREIKTNHSIKCLTYDDRGVIYAVVADRNRDCYLARLNL